MLRLKRFINKKTLHGDIFNQKNKLVVEKQYFTISRRKLMYFLLFLIVLIVSISFYMINKNSVISNKTTTPNFTSQTLVTGVPDYKTLIPADKTIKDLGGWTRVSPSGAEPVYAYADKINDIKIIVSQQPLPESISEDTAKQMEYLAKDFNANEKITLDNQIIYIANSDDGLQSLIFNRNDLLILIKSNAKIDNNQWVKYISSMK